METKNVSSSKPRRTEVENTKHSSGYDEAVNIFNGEISVEFTEKEASLVRWKLDLIVVPMVNAIQLSISLGLLLTRYLHADGI
jgi:hypothetical protein